MRHLQTVVFLAAIALSGCTYTRHFERTIHRGGCVFKIDGSSREDAVTDESGDFQVTITFPDGSTAFAESSYWESLLDLRIKQRINKWIEKHPSQCDSPVRTTTGTTTTTSTATGTSTPRPVNDGFD